MIVRFFFFLKKVNTEISANFFFIFFYGINFRNERKYYILFVWLAIKSGKKNKDVHTEYDNNNNVYNEWSNYISRETQKKKNKKHNHIKL